MHEGEIAVAVHQVERLVASQFPQWAGLPIKPVDSIGTVNRIFRLGDDMSVRLARTAEYVEDWERAQWLPRLAPHLPLPIPLPLARGEPAEGYPWEWFVYNWLPGDTATVDRITDPEATAVVLAEFLAALQHIEPAGGPPPGVMVNRGVPLARHDRAVRAALERLDGVVDTNAAAAAWEAALSAPEWHRPPVWFHGDFYSENLLVADGQLSGVIDFGGMAVGDPACDLVVAWDLLPAPARETFRSALGPDEAMWERGRGWALFMGLVAMPYYAESNPPFFRLARRLVGEVLAAA